MASVGEESERNSVIQKKVSKLLETRLDNDKETLVALKELSNFLTENTIQSRRNLRSKIEKRSLEINEEFLSSFRQVKESFDSIYNDVNEMNLGIQSISLQLNEGMAQTHALIEKTSKLQAEKNKLLMELDVTKSFLKRFQLAPNELATLRETTVTDDFFTVLERVQTIHSECRFLMQAGHQTAALDIMDQMSMYQEAAMERLYRWAQSHCKNIESLATGELLAKALAKLQTRPVFFKYVVSEYCTQRRAVLVRMFLDALTKGGPSGNPPPIENHSHDPHRYIGDMLAYLRQTIPGEANFLNTLLKLCNQSELGDVVDASLSEITEGVCTPLSVRVEQITSSDIPVKSLYTISGLISSYLRIFSQEVGKESGLVHCLQSLSDCTSQTLVTSLSQIVKKEVVSVSAPPAPNLGPSPSLTILTSLLQDLLSAPTDSNQTNLNKIVGCVVDPVLQAVNVSASRLSTADMAVYLLNCLHMIQNTLALYQFLDDRLERLQAQCDAQLDTLTSEQASSLVANLNLGPIYTILQEQGKSPLSQIPGMHSTNLQNFASKLENYLSLPEVLVLPQVNCLVSASHRSFVQQRSTEVILAIYRELYQCVHEPSNLYENPDDILPRSPEQLKEILLHMEG